ncbi:maleylpyruvate isomerase N-terminal domain-containing protein [Streptomyces sp. NBC_01477]|uniref:maleylpyruvate isomerase N-terminal domain-containing protein n=1 Tax=Streptomyces sp. NBC_01477 TaxID=2976015 RepID=UPI002E337765|nr:maleylpyruvate isomerase N-terminal domain-containing protein [Streptomyces sp. NBC_01477]
MTTSPEPRFEEWLDQIEERSAALRSAAGKAPSGSRIPACPDWTVPDLLEHVGGMQRFWAAAVAAGPAPRPPADGEVPDRTPTGDLLEWSAHSTVALLGALRAAGADARCWTWWADSGNAATAGAVARHQVQLAAVHVRDAQDAAGAPEPLPSGLAMDAIDEFLHVGFGSMDGWPHSPSRVALVADEGRTWTLILDETGASAVPSATGEGRPEADATVSAPASDLLLALYRRIPWDSGTLRVTGDDALVRQLVVWPPLD